MCSAVLKSDKFRYCNVMVNYLKDKAIFVGKKCKLQIRAKFLITLLASR